MEKLGQKTIKDIRKFKRNGMTISDIAKNCGVSDSSVKNYTKNFLPNRNTRRPGRPKKLTNQINQNIVGKFKSNEPK